MINNINAVQNAVGVKESQRVLSSTGLSNDPSVSFLGVIAETARSGKIVVSSENMTNRTGFRKEDFSWKAEVPEKEETMYDFLMKVQRLLQNL